jgi:hypothetical protein
MRWEQSITVAGLPGALFGLTQDYARRLQWDPFLRSATLLDGDPEAGLGVRAYCVAHSGWGMETEYVSFHPPRCCAVKMTKGPRLLARFAGSWRFQEVAPGQTRVSCCYHLRARPRWLAWLLTPPVGWIFARQMRKRLVALKAAVEQRGL